MVEVQRVAATREIDVLAQLAGRETVVTEIVDAAKTQGRPGAVAFGRVVEHDVEHDFDARIVQCVDGAVNARQRAIVEIAGLRGEIIQRAVAPVIAEPLPDEKMIVGERVYRQQFNARNAERAQVIDHGTITETGERTAHSFRQFGMAHRETAHVHLVNRRIGPRDRGSADIPAPGLRLDDDAFRGAGRAVAGIETQILERVILAETVTRIGPDEVTGEQAGIRIDQQLVRIETVSRFRRVGPVHAIAIALSRPDSRHEPVPYAIAAIGQREARGFVAPVAIEQTQLDPLGVRGIQREIHATIAAARAEWRGQSVAYCFRHATRRADSDARPRVPRCRCCIP